MERTFETTPNTRETDKWGNSYTILTSTGIIYLPAPAEQPPLETKTEAESSPAPSPLAEKPSKAARKGKVARVLKAAKVVKTAREKAENLKRKAKVARVLKAAKVAKTAREKAENLERMRKLEIWEKNIQALVTARAEMEKLAAQPPIAEPRPQPPTPKPDFSLLCLPAPEMKYLTYPPSSVPRYRQKGELCRGMVFECNGLHFQIVEMVGPYVKLLAWGDEDHEARWYWYDQVLYWYKKHLQNQDFIKRQKALTQTGRELIACLLYFYQQNGWVFKVDTIWTKLLDMNIFTNCIQVDLTTPRPNPIRYEIRPHGEVLAKEVLPIYLDKVKSLIQTHHVIEKRLREDSPVGKSSKTYVHLGKWGEV